MYDGLLEDVIGKKISITLEDKDFNIDIKDIVNHEFTIIDTSFKEQILEEIKFKKSKMFGTIQNEDGLPIYYKIIENDMLSNKYIILCAFGEIQPARYQIFLEGIWEFPL